MTLFSFTFFIFVSAMFCVNEELLIIDTPKEHSEVQPETKAGTQSTFLSQLTRVREEVESVKQTEWILMQRYRGGTHEQRLPSTWCLRRPEATSSCSEQCIPDFFTQLELCLALLEPPLHRWLHLIACMSVVVWMVMVKSQGRSCACARALHTDRRSSHGSQTFTRDVA